MVCQLTVLPQPCLLARCLKTFVVNPEVQLKSRLQNKFSHCEVGHFCNFLMNCTYMTGCTDFASPHGLDPKAD